VRRLLAARLLQSLIVVVLVTTISFFLVRLAPGDPFSYAGGNISPVVQDQWRRQFGYDRPVPEQFARYLGSVMRGRLGYSHTLHQPVFSAIATTLPRTLLLVTVALVLSFAIGISAGVIQAVRRGSLLDRVLSTVLLTLYSVPDFWLALMALLAFAYWLPIFPVGGIVDPVLHDYMSFWPALADRARHLVLPAVTLAVLIAAGIARYQRAALIEVLPMDYVRTARAKGLTERSVIVRHALRNALLPVITIFGLLLPAVAGGAFFVEKVFSWPGMGLLIANAVAARDYDLVTGSVIVGGVMVAVGSLLADLLYAAVDPRLRTG
jgi:peptide/nickel transport system permease protein